MEPEPAKPDPVRQFSHRTLMAKAAILRPTRARGVPGLQPVGQRRATPNRPRRLSNVPNSRLCVAVIVALCSHRRCAAERVEAALREPLEAFRLGQQNTSEPALNLSFRDHLGEAGDD